MIETIKLDIPNKNNYICRMNFFRVLVFILFLTHCSEAAVLSGTVSESDRAIPFATLGIKGTGLGVQCNEDGRFRLADIPAGDWTVEVKAAGYKTFTQRISLKADEQRLLNPVLQPEGKELEEIVVSGTLKPVSRLESAIPVEVYTPAFFKRNPTSHVFDALQLVNGVQPQIGCNVCQTGDIHINGMEGPYTMVLIDGMPIVSSLSTVYGLTGIPNSMIRRVEVVKGPAGTLYGSEAMGGLINIITRDPLTSPRFFAEVNAGSQQEFSADVAGRWKQGRWNSLMALNTFYNPGIYDVNNDNFTDITLQKRVSLFNKWTYSRRDTLPLQFALRYMYEDRWGGELQWTPEWRGSDSIYGESIYTSRLEAIGQAGLRIGDEVTLLEFSYNRHVQDSWYGTMYYYGHQETAFAQWRWNRKLGRHYLMAGLPVRYTWYDDNTPGTRSSNTDCPDNMPMRTLLAGVFIQDDISLSEKWNLLPGIRYDYNNNHGSIFSPRFAARYRIRPDHSLRFSTGNGFRVVNLFTEDHAALSGAREVVIAETLRPEQSWNATLNYSGQYQLRAGILTLDASSFYTVFSNRILGDFMSDPQKIIYRNLQRTATSRGLSLGLSFQSTGSLRGNLGVTWMEVFTEEEGMRIPQIHAPAWSGTGGLTYTHPRNTWVVDFTFRTTGPMFLPVVPNDFRPAKSPWFTLANVQVTRRYRQWEIFGGVRNLFNFLPDDPILRPFDPFDRETDVNNSNGYTFDPSYNYAPVQGIRAFAGFRYQLF